MQYIVLDLEWNQPYSKERAVRLASGRPLMSEIIQIGAVRVDGDKQIRDHFLSAVAPRFYRELHYKVRQLTGLSGRQLKKGPSLREAAEALRAWCGEDFAFVTWSNMDIPILLENLQLHGLDSSWVGAWYDLQQIFNAQTGSGSGQKSLSFALEQLQLPMDAPFHDALNDAYATARICQKLDIERGIREYYTRSFLPENQLHQDALGHQMSAYMTFSGPATREQLMREPSARLLFCPVCGRELEPESCEQTSEDASNVWTACPEHGRFLFKVRLKSMKRSQWCVAVAAYTEEEALKPDAPPPPKKRRRRRRSRGGKRGRGRGAKKVERAAEKAAERAVSPEGES